MFSGMSNHSIDAKGRIVLPAKFREELGETFCLVQGFDNQCIQAMTIELYESICAKILELPANLSRALQYTFNGSAQNVTPNAQGRVLIPQSLRKYAAIEEDALVIGMNNRIEIWNKQKFDEFMGTQQSNIAQALSMLKL